MSEAADAIGSSHDDFNAHDKADLPPRGDRGSRVMRGGDRARGRGGAEYFSEQHETVRGQRGGRGGDRRNSGTNSNPFYRNIVGGDRPGSAAGSAGGGPPQKVYRPKEDK